MVYITHTHKIPFLEILERNQYDSLALPHVCIGCPKPLRMSVRSKAGKSMNLYTYIDI